MSATKISVGIVGSIVVVLAALIGGVLFRKRLSNRCQRNKVWFKEKTPNKSIASKESRHDSLLDIYDDLNFVTGTDLKTKMMGNNELAVKDRPVMNHLRLTRNTSTESLAAKMGINSLKDIEDSDAVYQCIPDDISLGDRKGSNGTLYSTVSGLPSPVVSLRRRHTSASRETDGDTSAFVTDPGSRSKGGCVDDDSGKSGNHRHNASKMGALGTRLQLSQFKSTGTYLSYVDDNEESLEPDNADLTYSCLDFQEMFDNDDASTNSKVST